MTGSTNVAGEQAAARRRGRLVLAAVGLAVVALVAWALWPKPVDVEAGAVTAGPMTVAIEEEGKTRIKDVFIVSAPQTGIVRRSPLIAGDAVVKDKTLVALLQPAQPPFLDMRMRLEVMAQVKAGEAAVRLADAELSQAQADRRFAEAEVVRSGALAASKTISDKLLEKAQHDAEVARAAVAKAEANRVVRQRQLESIQARLVDPDDETVGGVVEAGCCVEVRAPVTGRVLRVHQTSEQVVPAGTPLAEVGDPRSIEIVVELLSTDAVRIAEGAHVAVDGWGRGDILTGSVRRIEAAGFTKVSALGIEEQRVRVIVDLDAASLVRHRLGHEYRVIASIRSWESANALQVPIGALFRHQGDWVVYKIATGQAARTIVRLGQKNSTHAEVLDGLTGSDRVVLYPSDRVFDGTRISVRRPASAR